MTIIALCRFYVNSAVAAPMALVTHRQLHQTLDWEKLLPSSPRPFQWNMLCEQPRKACPPPGASSSAAPHWSHSGSVGKFSMPAASPQSQNARVQVGRERCWVGAQSLYGPPFHYAGVALLRFAEQSQSLQSLGRSPCLQCNNSLHEPNGKLLVTIQIKGTPVTSSVAQRSAGRGLRHKHLAPDHFSQT
jgi:hypothetical protein